MAVTATARVIVAGMALDGSDDPTSAVATALMSAGMPVTARVLIEDDEAALEAALLAPCDVTVILAGAGGSGGDIVRRALARATGARLMLSERMRSELGALAARRDRPLSRRSERLALIPQGASVLTIENAEPGWLVETRDRAWIVLTPGAGLARAIEQHVTPYARARAAGRALAITTLRTAGVDPGEIEERLGEWLGPGGAVGDVEVSTLPASGEVWVRLRARGPSEGAASDALAGVATKIIERLGDDYFGRDDETLERVVGRLLTERGMMVSVAESCTGGLLGHRITSIAGSSAYFERGVMVYTNRAKHELLGVANEVLTTHGAVSGPCAEAMVRGVCRLGGSACGLAVTGIAGPSGGTPTMPVGSVWIGVAVAEEVEARRFLFEGDRASIKWQSAQRALDLLRRALLANR